MNILRLAMKRADDVVELDPAEIQVEPTRSYLDTVRLNNDRNRNQLISQEAALEAEIARLTKQLGDVRLVLAASDAFASTLDQAEQIAAE